MTLTVAGVPIYGIADNGDLMWYYHRGFMTGNADWANMGQGIKVGNGWNEGRFVFKGNPRGDDGVIYRINSQHELIWYKHHGHAGNNLQAWSGGRQVGHGWHDARKVFSGGPGIIYMIDKQGDLYWYRHEGYHDGTPRWGRTAKVGNGWNIARTTFSGGGGVIYLVTTGGEMFWYKHLGFQDGQPSWAERTKVGVGWQESPDIFSGGEGIVYAMRRDGSLHWYRHTGHLNGEGTWEAPTGRRIGSGWAEFVRNF